MDDILEGCADKFARMGGCARCLVLTTMLALVAVVVYIAVAIEGVEPTEYAIIRNNVDQSIHPNKTLDGGLHWVGLFYSLIKYPATNRVIEFSNDEKAASRQLSTRTKEGLELKLHVAFQYKLRRETLPKLYRFFQGDYEQFYARIARNSVLSVASDYNATQYWVDRSQLGDDFKKKLGEDLEGAYADVVNFFLMKIDLPDVYEGAIVATQVTKQEVVLYETLRAVNETQTTTDNIRLRAEASILKIQSEANRNATILKNQGAGKLAQQNIKYTTEALAEVQDLLKFKKKSTSLLEYYKLQKIAAMHFNTQNKLIIGDFAATVSMTNNGQSAFR